MIRNGFLSPAERLELEACVRRQREDHGIARRANAMRLLDDGKITFIHLDLAAEHGLAFGLQFNGDDFAQTKKVEGRCFTVHATQAGRGSSRRARDKMLNQTVLFISAQTALAHRPHDNPKSRLSGTAPSKV